MIKFITGDIFETTMPAIGHGVNTQSDMSGGIARAIKAMFPDVWLPYVQACQLGELVPGWFLPVEVRSEPSLLILNLASQEKPGADARLEWLEESMANAISYAELTGLEGFAVPRIGAGIGGLDWETEVKPLMEKLAAETDVLIEVWSQPDA